MLAEFLAQLLGGQQAGGLLGNVAASRFDGPGAHSDPGVQAIMAQGAQRPAQAFSPQQAPQGQPMPSRAPQAAPANSGGGMGGMIQNLFNPGASQKNKTVEWLMRDGLDEGTATFMASDRDSMRNYIANRGQRGKPLEVNGRLVDPNTYQVLADFSDKKGNAPAAVQEYEYARAQGFPGTFQDWEASKKGGMSLQVDPTTGAVTFQQGGNIKPLTESQSKDTVYATRAAGALPIIDQFGGALTSLPESTAGSIPGVGNYMKSKEFQQAEQAGKEFLQAILRKDTGAAIHQHEMDSYGSVYLPRPGDGPEVLAQKQASRARALEAIKAGMPAQAILAQEKALANSAVAGSRTIKSIKDLSDAELEAIINGE